MKTPMQQLIDRINDLKISCSDPDANWLADMLIRDISEGSKFDKSFLEMEKEQIMDAWVDGDNSDCLSEQDSSDFAERYYNETFNSTEDE
jgi:hypothetical protein